MKKALSLMLLAAVVLSSCSKEVASFEQGKVSAQGNSVIVAYLDEDAVAMAAKTKVSLIDGVKLGWAVGDQIIIGDNKIFTVDSVDPDNPCKAYFTGTAPAAAEKYRAFFPSLSYSSTPGNFILSDTQNYGQDNIVTDVNYMYAETTDYKEIHFHNVCGLLAIDLKGEGTVSNIQITADQYLSGCLAEMAVSEKGVLTYGEIAASAQNYVNLDCGSAATLSKETARRFYVAVPENDYTNLKLIVTTDKGTMTIPATKTASVKKNNIYHLPEITVDTRPAEFEASIAVIENKATSPLEVLLRLSVTPADKDVYYMFGVTTPKYFNQFEDSYEFAKKNIEFYSTNYSFSELVNDYGTLMKGDKQSLGVGGLDPDTDYVAYAYSVDENFNVSAAVTLDVHTAKVEYDEYDARYSDYLGQWAMGTDLIVIEELENGSTYKVSGFSSLSETDAIPYVIAYYIKGNFVLNEYYTGITGPAGGFTNCELYLAGRKSGKKYPFDGSDPSMILYGQFSNDQINVYSIFDTFSIACREIRPNGAEGMLFWLSETTITSVMKHPETIPEALFGQWQVTDGYKDAVNTDRTGWTWTLSPSGVGVKIDNFDPMLADRGAGAYIPPVLTWDGSTKTLTLAGGTTTTYSGIKWYGYNSNVLSDLTFVVDLENGTITLADEAFVTYKKDVGFYSWYDAPLVFNKVASTTDSAAPSANSDAKKAIPNPPKAFRTIQMTSSVQADECCTYANDSCLYENHSCRRMSEVNPGSEVRPTENKKRPLRSKTG